VIEFEPTGSVVRLIAATPLFTVPDPMGLPPLRKLTTPLVTPTPLASTVAERVTLEPKAKLGEEALTTVIVGAAATVRPMTFESEAPKLEVPP
jgi:hypothetical protein